MFPVSRLKTLLLFLLFQDKYASKSYVFETVSTLHVILVCYLSVGLGLVLGSFLILGYGLVSFLAYYVALAYTMAQVLHVYDYTRARS